MPSEPTANLIRMSDAVAVALVAVIGTFISGGLGYLAARGKTKAELVSIEGETTRLEKTLAESMRDARTDMYRNFLAAVANIQDRARRVGDGGTVEEAVREANSQLGEVQLLAPPEVLAKAEALILVIAGFTTACAELEAENIERIGRNEKQRSETEVTSLAMSRTSRLWQAAREELLDAMRGDLEARAGAARRA